MSFVVLPRANLGFLAEPRFGETSLSAVSGVWSVVTALAIASLVLAVIMRRRLPHLRKTLAVFGRDGRTPLVAVV